LRNVLYDTKEMVRPVQSEPLKLWT
jgi:hypothetical protein